MYQNKARTVMIRQKTMNRIVPTLPYTVFAAVPAGSYWDAGRNFRSFHRMISRISPAMALAISKQK